MAGVAMGTTRRRPSVHRWQAILGALGIAAVFAAAEIIRLGFHNRPVWIDSPWHDFLAAHRTPWLEYPCLALNLLGGTIAMTVLTIVVVALLARRNRLWSAGFVAATTTIAAVLSTTIKNLGERPRPGDSLVATTTDALPSGHTTATAALVIALALGFGGNRLWSRWALWCCAVLVVAAMAFSRTYLLAHWFTDTLGGALLGSSVAVLIWALLAGRIRGTEQRSSAAAPADSPAPKPGQPAG